jgi:hypothetical protein
MRLHQRTQFLQGQQCPFLFPRIRCTCSVMYRPPSTASTFAAEPRSALQCLGSSLGSVENSV